MRECRHLLPASPAVLAIVALHLVGDYLAIPAMTSLELSDPAEPIVACVLFGGMMGQLALLVGYQAWGRDDWLRRWAKSTFLLMLCWTALAAGAKSTGNSFEVSSIPELLANVMFGTFICLSVPFWGARLLVGLRFDHVRSGSTPADAGRPQFYLRDLMVATVGAAVVFCIMQSPIGREALRPNWSVSWNELRDLAIFESIMAALCAIAAIPAACFALGQRRWGAALVVLLAYVVAVVAVEEFVYYTFIDDNSYGWLIVTGLNTGVVAQVLLTALVLRACGYRLRLREK